MPEAPLIFDAVLRSALILAVLVGGLFATLQMALMFKGTANGGSKSPLLGLGLLCILIGIGANLALGQQQQQAASLLTETQFLAMARETVQAKYPTVQREDVAWEIQTPGQADYWFTTGGKTIEGKCRVQQGRTVACRENPAGISVGAFLLLLGVIALLKFILG